MLEEGVHSNIFVKKKREIIPPAILGQKGRESLFRNGIRMKNDLIDLCV